MYLSNLSTARRRRFERHGDPADVDRAVEAGELAVTAVQGHPIRFGIAASALAAAYRARYQNSADPADLDRAIEIGRRRVSAMPAEHPRRADSQSGLSSLHLLRFTATGDQRDAHEALALGELALAATPDGDTTLPGTLTTLVSAYAIADTDLTADSGRVRELARKLDTARTASPIVRIIAGQLIGAMASSAADWQTAAGVYDSTVSLLPIVASPAKEQIDREQLLARWNLGLVSGAMAAHLGVADPIGAVEVAELGRGVMLAAELDSRSELTDLAERDPQLAAEFERLRRRLDTPAEDGDDSPVRAHAGTRWQLWRERDRLLVRIRELPGLAEFLAPPAYAGIQQAVRGGFGVLVNPIGERSAAIIISPDGPPIVVPLPDLRGETAAERVVAFRKVMHEPPSLRTIQDRSRVFTEILGWLWDSVAAPVIERLPGHDGTQPTRIWWLPTALVATLPLHAAGHPGSPGALGHLVSSYVPTLRALAHARSRPAARERRQMVVAMEHTTGLRDLPGAADESRLLHAAQPDLHLLRNTRATIDMVLAQLPTSTWCHFACHALADPESPSLSALQLHGGPLTVGRISRLRLESAELAYLSACSTAHSGLRLPDESIHLASAFHLAGFKHVIASLWPLQDSVAADASRHFYRGLPPTADADRAAYVLHGVVQRLRAEHPDRPDLWASLIHSGP